MHTPFDADLQNFDVATPVGRGLAFRDQSRHQPKGTGSQCSPIFGVYAYTPCHRNTKFDVGEDSYLGVSHASHLKRPELWLPNYCGSPVFMTTPFNAERPYSAWYHLWEGTCQPRHCICTNASRGLRRQLFLVNRFC